MMHGLSAFLAALASLPVHAGPGSSAGSAPATQSAPAVPVNAAQMRAMVSEALGAPSLAGVTPLGALDPSLAGAPLAAQPAAAAPGIDGFAVGFIAEMTPAEHAALAAFLELTPAPQAEQSYGLAPLAKGQATERERDRRDSARMDVLLSAQRALEGVTAEQLRESPALAAEVAARFASLMDNARRNAGLMDALVQAVQSRSAPDPTPRRALPLAYSKAPSAPFEVAAERTPNPHNAQAELDWRRVRIGGAEYVLAGEADSMWFTALDAQGNETRGETGSPVKIHVITDSPEDLGRLQALLIPLLLNDPDVGAFKTLDPLHGSGRSQQAPSSPPNGKGQYAKAFTVYGADAAAIARVRGRISRAIAEAGLARNVPVDSGILDMLDSTNRVGTVRERFRRGYGSKRMPGILIDPVLSRRLTREFRKAFGIKGSRPFTRAELSEIERRTGLKPGTLSYGSGSLQDKSRRLLMLSGGFSGGVMSTLMDMLTGRGAYTQEAAAGSAFGDLEERFAFYALARRYGIDHLDIADHNAVYIEDSIAPGERVAVGRLSEGAGSALAARHARIGRNARGNWYVRAGRGDAPVRVRLRLAGRVMFDRRLAAGEMAPLDPRVDEVFFGDLRATWIHVPRPEGYSGRAIDTRAFVQTSGLSIAAVDSPADGKGKESRRVTVAGSEFALESSGNSWFYGLKDGKRDWGPHGSPVKLHVITDSPADLGRLQAALLPALFADPDVSAFKTMDPLYGVGRGPEATGPEPTGKDQRAKAFTVYAKNADAVARIRDRLSALIAREKLARAEPVATGNVDTMDATNRIGAVRDKFRPALTRYGEPAFLIDPVLARHVRREFKKAFGLSPEQRFTPTHLGEIERVLGLRPDTLQYGRLGSGGLFGAKNASRRDARRNSSASENTYLVLSRTVAPDEDGFDLEDPGYATESGSGKNPGDLSDRPALYAIARRYGIDHLELGVDDVPIERSLKSGESIVLGNRSQAIDGETVAARHAVVGRDETGAWYLENGRHDLGTWVRRSGEQKVRVLAPGERVPIAPGDDIRLGPLYRLRFVGPV